MTPTFGHRLISGLSLIGLGVLGIAAVTVPVTLALVFHAPASRESTSAPAAAQVIVHHVQAPACPFVRSPLRLCTELGQ